MAFDRKAYYQRTREKQLETAAKWRSENKERHAEATLKSVRGRRGRDPIGYLLERAKHRAKTKRIAFDLERCDITIPETCPVLGIPLYINEWTGRRDKNPNSPSIDRIDPSRGYVKGNIQIISWRANFLKSDGTIEEFQLLVKHLLGWQSG